MTYAEKKEQIRQQAIEWQCSWSDNCYSYDELAYYSDYFEKNGQTIRTSKGVQRKRYMLGGCLCS